MPSVSLFRDVDVLVVGSSSSAVAAALEIRRAGRSTMVVSDLSYVGSDLAGTFRLWPGQWTEADPLLRAAFAESSVRPARPGTVKRVMEEALLKAGIDFLFHTRPVALLRDEAGGIGGAVLAARTALFAVTCRAIIDASDGGLVIRLAAPAWQTRDGIPAGTQWTVLGKDKPASWPGLIEEIEPSFVQQQEEGPATYRAFRLGIEKKKPEKKRKKEGGSAA